MRWKNTSTALKIRPPLRAFASCTSAVRAPRACAGCRGPAIRRTRNSPALTTPLSNSWMLCSKSGVPSGRFCTKKAKSTWREGTFLSGAKSSAFVGCERTSPNPALISTGFSSTVASKILATNTTSPAPARSISSSVCCTGSRTGGTSVSPFEGSSVVSLPSAPGFGIDQLATALVAGVAVLAILDEVAIS